MYSAFVIIFVSLAAALLTEGASWYLIYRKEEYQQLKSSIETLQSKVDKLKDAAPPALLASTTTSSSSTKASATKAKAKAKPSKQGAKLDLHKQQLKTKQQQLTSQRFKSTVITTIVLIALYQLLSRTVGASVVGRLPFEPFGLVRGLSHRGLSGEDWYDCSFAFLYALCQMAIRANVTRFFGFVPRDETGLSSFMPNDEEEDK